MLRRCWMLFFLPFAGDLQAITIESFAIGFANETPGFWGVGFQYGAPEERIASVVLEMPGEGSSTSMA